MRPIQALPAGAPSTNWSGPRRRNRPLPDLSIAVPQSDLCVPTPLPQTSISTPTSSHQLSFSELDRVKRIGSGSYGTIYKVIHRPTNRLFALKVICGNHHEDSVRRQILREFEILSDVDHPNVVKCHYVFDHQGEIQVLLEFMEGGSLEGTKIADEGQLSEFARQILCGLLYLHRRQIIHRNIKPSNLLINSRKNVKMTDFGVSRILAQTMDPYNWPVGTIAYVSPERINTDLNHGQYDEYAGDIWSFGVTILEFYLGRFPFAVESQGDWASLISEICISQPPAVPSSASREFRDFITCCLQKDPMRRWTAAELLQHPFILRNSAGGGQIDHIIQLESNAINYGTHQRGDGWSRKVNLEWMFVITNFALEIPSSIFDQLSSMHKPQYALISMLMSFIAMLLSIIDLIYKGRKERVVWRWTGTIPWFYYPSPSDLHFGTFRDIVGLACAIPQFIVAAITYSFVLRNVDNPIKISILPIIFAFGLLCSKFSENPNRRNLY